MVGKFVISNFTVVSMLGHGCGGSLYPQFYYKRRENSKCYHIHIWVVFSSTGGGYLDNNGCLICQNKQIFLQEAIN